MEGVIGSRKTEIPHRKHGSNTSRCLVKISEDARGASLDFIATALEGYLHPPSD